MPEPLSAQLTRLIVDRIGSVEALEALLLLARTPDKWWTAKAVADEIGDQPASASRALDGLCANNLLDVRIAQDVLFKYAPRAGDADLVRQLVETYRTRRIAVLQLLSRRVDSVREFAEAFRVGKKKGSEDG